MCVPGMSAMVLMVGSLNRVVLTFALGGTVRTRAMPWSAPCDRKQTRGFHRRDGSPDARPWSATHHSPQTTETDMATLHFHETTTSTPEQFIDGLTDFGPGRAELFGNSADDYLEVHDRGPDYADV